MPVAPGLELQRQVAEKLMAMGLIYQENGDIEEAISLYKQAISEAPHWSDLYYYLGLAQYKKGNFSQAIISYKQGIFNAKNYPKLAKIGLDKIYYNLGVCLQDIGRIEEAIKIYGKAIDINPKYINSYNNLGCLLVQKGELQEGVRVLEAAIDQYDQDAVIYINLAQAFLALDKPGKALCVCQKAIELQPEQITGYYHLACALQRLGKHREALEYLERVLRLNPKFKSALYHKIESLIETGDIQGAIAHLKPLVTDDNPWINHYCNQCQKLTCPDQDEWENAKKACGNFLQALKQREISTQAIDYFAETHLHLGNVMVEYGEPKKGESHYHKALLANPKSTLIYLRLGYCLSQQGRKNAAKIVYQMASLHSGTDVASLPAIKDDLETSKVGEEKSCDGLNCRPCLDQILKSFNPRSLGSEIYQLDFDKTLINNSPYQSVDILNNGRVWVAPKKNEWMICNAIAVWDDQDQFVPKLSRNYPGQLPNCHNYHPHKSLKIPELPPSEFVEGTVAVLSGLSGHIYFHWMVDILPRFDILKNQGFDISKIDWFLINSYRQPFQKETLIKLGVPLSKIIESDRHPHIQAERLIIPSFPDALGWLSSQSLKFHRQHFLPAVKTPKPNLPSRLYISRNQASYRQILNENEIINYLEKHDFSSVNLESLTLEKQVSLFANAEVIISPHGSGLTNLMFCRPGTKVVELISPHYIRHYYWVISQQLGLHHYYIKGEEFDCYPIRQLMYPNPLTEDILISQTSLVKIIDILGITQSKTMVSFSPSPIRQLPQNPSISPNGYNKTGEFDSLNRGSKSMLDSSSNIAQKPPQVPSSLWGYPEDLEVYLQGAEALYNQGDYEQAAQACQRVISQGANARSYKLLGNVRQAQGRVEEAKRWYAKAIQLQPNFAEAFTNLGTLYAQEKQWQEAIACYQKAISLQPKLGAAYRNLARAWTQLGKIIEATECWYQAYSIDPQLVSAEEHINLANKLMEIGLVTQAVSSYCHAIEADPNCQQAYRHLGEAIKRHQKLDPDDLEYQDYLTLQATGSIKGQSSKRRMRLAYPAASELDNNPKNKGFFAKIKGWFLGERESYPFKSANPNSPRQQPRANIENDWSSEPTFREPYQSFSDIWMGDETGETQGFSDENYLGFEDYLQRAEIAAKLGNLPTALAECQNALKLQPNLPQAYKILGQVEQAQIHREAAQTYYEKAISLGLQDGEVYLNLGSLYAYQQQWQKAIECYHKSLDLQPKSALAYWNLAKIWRRLGKNVEMIDCLYEAYCLEPEKVTAEAHLQLGNNLLKYGQKTQAIACYKKAVQLDSNLTEASQKLQELERLETTAPIAEPPDIQLNGKPEVADISEVELQDNNSVVNVPNIEDEIKRAESHIIAKEFAEAIAICEQLFTRETDNAKVYKVWGNALQGLGQVQEARDKYNQAVIIDPNFAEVHANLGSLYAREKALEEAINCYERAITIKPDLAAANRNLARIWKQLGKVEEWAKSWNQALALEPEATSAKEDIDLGHALIEQGDSEGAITCYQRAIKSEKCPVELYAHLGELLISKKRWQEAISVYRKGVENYPNQSEFYGKLGQVLVEMDKLDDGILFYKQAVQMNPELVWVYYDLADIFFEKGELEGAISYYQKVVELEPQNWAAYNSLGDAYQQQGLVDEAVEAYQKAIACKDHNQE